MHHRGRQRPLGGVAVEGVHGHTVYCSTRCLDADALGLEDCPRCLHAPSVAIESKRTLIGCDECGTSVSDERITSAAENWQSIVEDHTELFEPWEGAS